MANSAFSFGVAEVKLGGSTFGANTAASVSISITTVPIHESKVGSAKLVGSKFVVKSMQGVLNFTTEEVGLIGSILSSIQPTIKGEVPEELSFTCKVPMIDATISGKVLALPLFSGTAVPEGWSTFSFKLPIIGALTAAGGGAITVENIGGVPFIKDFMTKAVYTKDTANLCAGVEADAGGCSGAVGELSIDTSCQYRPIYRDDIPWPKAYVVDSCSIVAEVGFYDFTSLAAMYNTNTSCSISFSTIGGSSASLNLGVCVATLSGMKSLNGLNTWTVRVEGNAI